MKLSFPCALRSQCYVSCTYETIADRIKWIIYLTETNFCLLPTTTSLLTWTWAVHHTRAITAIWAHIFSGSLARCSTVTASTHRITAEQITRIFYLVETNHCLLLIIGSLLTWTWTIHHIWAVAASWTHVSSGSITRRNAIASSTHRVAIDRVTGSIYLTETNLYLVTTTVSLLTWTWTVHHIWAVIAIWAHILIASVAECSAVASSTHRITVD